MSEDYSDYSVTYLGESGVTYPCMMAMAGILTSAFQAEKITAVIGETDELRRHESVLFLVWNWAGQGLTIIPDGFGTHGGEGGAGLSKVLGLVKFYKIPLQQVWILDDETFQELAQGKLTEEMFDKIQEEAQDYDWNFYSVSEVRKVRKGKYQFLEILRENGIPDFSIRLP